MKRRHPDRLGPRLRELRERAGLTIKELSLRSGISASTLSRVENGKLSASYPKLINLSEALQIDLQELFDTPSVGSSQSSPTRLSVARRLEGLKVTSRNIDFYFLFEDLVTKAITPQVLRIKARSREEYGRMVSHDGEEVNYVLTGEVTIYTEHYRPVTLKAGDCIYLDTSMAHCTVNTGKGEALILSVSSHPHKLASDDRLALRELELSSPFDQIDSKSK